MKKFLFTMALVVAAATCNAQALTASKSLSAKYLNAKVFNGPVASPSASVAPKKSRESGVYYERPEGLWYSGYQFGDEGLTALHCPALVDFTFVNGCNNPSAATWTIGGSDITQYADDENNMGWSYDGISASNEYGYNLYYAPTINYKGDSFSITDLMLINGSASAICDFNSSLCEMYSGFTDGPAWGTGSALEAAIQEEVEGVDGFLGYRKDFEKPISPLYVTSISMPMWSSQIDFLGGKALTIKIYELVEKIDEESGKTYMGLGALKDSLTCKTIDSEYNMSLNGYYADEVQFSKTVINDFGEDEAAPITIDYPFSLVISGFNQEGVDARMFLLDRSDDEFEFENANPTRILTQVGDATYGYYWMGEQDGTKYDYSFPIYFNALYDNVFVATQASSQDGTTYDGANYVEVSTDGTTCQNYLYREDYPGAIVSTATPWNDGSDDNYYAEYPEWITGMSATEIDAENYPGEYVVSFTADPLPEGVEGRGAYLYIEGRGVVSEDPIFVYQGDLEKALADGVNSVKADANVSMKGMFNLAGQKVSGNFKGIVIKDGKKLINK